MKKRAYPKNEEMHKRIHLARPPRLEGQAKDVLARSVRKKKKAAAAGIVNYQIRREILYDERDAR